MLTALIDYESGNLHSALKAFEKWPQSRWGRCCCIRSRRGGSRRSSGFTRGRRLSRLSRCLINSAIYDALCEAVEQKARPFMGICVGMQLMAKGHEYTQTPGLGWIDGAVHKIAPTDHRSRDWNNSVIDYHPIFDGLRRAIAYFVHSYQMQVASPEQRIAYVDYAGDVTAVVARDTMIGLQFHPEKSASQGLSMIGNFLTWRP